MFSDVKISAFHGDYYYVMGHGSITLVRSGARIFHVSKEYKLLSLCIKASAKKWSSELESEKMA